MQGIKDVSLSDLHREVELVGETTLIVGGSDLLHHPYLIEFNGGWDRALSIRALAKANPYLIRGLDQLDGKVAFKWHSHEEVETTLRLAIRDLEAFSGWVRESFETQGHTRENVKDLVDRVMKIARPNKRGVATIKNSLRAVAEIYGITNIDVIIKDVTTKANLSGQKLYVYKTHTNIEQHYSTLSKSQHLTSCMTKGSDELGDNHLVEVDKAKAESAGYTVRKVRDKDVMFMPNVASLNGQTDVALGLVSRLSPEELQTADEYAFVGRMILWRGEFEGKEEWRYTRFYGREGLETSIGAVVPHANTAQGYTVRGYMTIVPNEVDNLGIATPRYVLPYIDGDDNVLERVGERQVDELGRAYYMFEIINGRKYNYDPDDYDSIGNRFYVCQNDWVVKPFKWRGTCAVTGQDITERSGWVLNGKTVRYDLAQWGLSYNQLRNAKGLILSLDRNTAREVKRLEAEVKQLETEIKSLNHRLAQQAGSSSPSHELDTDLIWTVPWLVEDRGKGRCEVHNAVGSFNRHTVDSYQHPTYVQRVVHQMVETQFNIAYETIQGSDIVRSSNHLLLTDVLTETVRLLRKTVKRQNNLHAKEELDRWIYRFKELTARLLHFTMPDLLTDTPSEPVTADESVVVEGLPELTERTIQDFVREIA